MKKPPVLLSEENCDTLARQMLLGTLTKDGDGLTEEEIERRFTALVRWCEKIILGYSLMELLLEQQATVHVPASCDPAEFIFKAMD